MALLKEYRKVWLENRLKVGDFWQGSDRLFADREAADRLEGLFTGKIKAK